MHHLSTLLQQHKPALLSAAAAVSRRGPQAEAQAAPTNARQPEQQQQQPQPGRQQRRRSAGNADAEARSFRRALRFPPAQLPPVRDESDPEFDGTRAARRRRLLQQLQQAYGPAFGDRDVRLFLKRRALNQQQPRRRAGFPLDDSFESPETFLKLSEAFQRTILSERSDALSSVVHQLTPGAAWQLYATIPGLMTWQTLTVAQRLHGLSRALGLPLPQLAALLCRFRRLALLEPGAAEVRLGLLARVTRLERSGALALLMQQPRLWTVNSQLLGSRAEQLALLLGCCTVTAVKLLGSCPRLLTAPVHVVQQQMAELLGLFPGQQQPALLLPLLLSRPSLLLPPRAMQEQLQQRPGLACNMQQLQRQIEALAAALQLPGATVQQMVLRAPDLLQLVSSSSSSSSSSSDRGGLADTAAAAVERVSCSWLCAGGAATRRWQYQQQLTTWLLPPSSNKQQQQQHKPRRPKHQLQLLQEAGARFLAAGALQRALLDCQWWPGGGSGLGTPRQQRKANPALQQLLVQAPAVLLLATADLQLAAAAAAPVADRLDVRLQELAQHLLAVICEQQQPQRQQQQQHASASRQAAAGNELLQQVQSAAVLEPCLLAQPPQLAAAQLQRLARALAAADAGSLWPAVAACPAVLWLTPGQLHERVRVLCGVLRLSAPQLGERLLASADALAVLLMEPAAVKAAADRLPAADRERVRRQVQLLLPGRVIVM